jgi:hypothetical protein
MERVTLLAVVLSELVLAESILDESAPSRFSTAFDDVGREETTVDTSILMR